MANRYERHRQKIMAKLAGKNDILDIGCTNMPNSFLTGKRVVGLDINPMDVKPPYTKHIVGDITDIDSLLTGQKFDAVLMGEFIEHVERPYDVIRAARQFIAPNGKLIISTPNILGIPAVFAEYLGINRFYGQNHVYCFGTRWIRRILEKCDFQLTNTIGCGIWFAGLPIPAPAVLSYQVIYVAK